MTLIWLQITVQWKYPCQGRISTPSCYRFKEVKLPHINLIPNKTVQFCYLRLEAMDGKDVLKLENVGQLFQDLISN